MYMMNTFHHHSEEVSRPFLSETLFIVAYWLVDSVQQVTTATELHDNIITIVGLKLLKYSYLK